MLALKPGLFPLPRLRCLLFLRAAFHSGFNSLQTLPNGFFTWGPQARSGIAPVSRNFTPPLDTKKRGSFSHTSPSLPGAALFAPRTRNGVGRGVDPNLWGWQMSWWLMDLDAGCGDR